MASVGHIAVGMAAARAYHQGRTPPWSSLASWSALSLLPDADVVGFALGIDYTAPWGHRGATHSLALSVALGLTIGLAAGWFKRPAARTALFASLALASHALLDTMTDGGLGCALLWPFNLARYFAPWRPIPVAPIGLDFFSSYGALVALTELVLFGPLLVYALRFPKAAARPVAAGLLIALWAVPVWLIVSSDRTREAIVGFVLREDTAYASGFSEDAFRMITPGTSDDEVRRLLGPPLAENWLYLPRDQPSGPASERSASALPTNACLAIRFEAGVVVSAQNPRACSDAGIKPGMSQAEIEKRLGSAPERCWQYSWSPAGARFRLRIVCFSDASVASVIRQWN